MVIILYKTDNWHSYGSRDMIAICTGEMKPVELVVNEAVQLVKEQAEKEGETISSDDEYNLRNIKQTQGYKGEGEFDYEIYNQDELNRLI